MRLPASFDGVAPMPRHWVRVRRLDAIEDGTIVPVVVRGTHLILIRENHRIYATERACPHEGADLSTGRCLHGNLFCPRHFAWFGLEDGQVHGGWHFRRLRTYRTYV
ncbi:Rieske (2Fe-2S) protein, partial [uncultured Methylobacterium sp.]|uniref:Rieske (2Fe-2S) protein n=1 Tax=uncultured Methylobacterium sp. TaxID=157278 RepID=UPI0035CA65E2